MTAVVVAAACAAFVGWFTAHWIRTSADFDHFAGTEAARHCAEYGHDYRAEPGTAEDVCRCCGGYQLRRWTT